MRDKIIKLLSLTYLNKDAMPQLVEGYISVTGEHKENLVDDVLEYINSSKFIDFASHNFFRVFDESEVDELLKFYDSDVAKKFNANSNFLSDCIYQEISRFIKDEIAAGV